MDKSGKAMGMKDPWNGIMVVKVLSHEHLQAMMKEWFVLDAYMWEEVVE